MNLKEIPCSQSFDEPRILNRTLQHIAHQTVVFVSLALMATSETDLGRAQSLLMPAACQFHPTTVNISPQTPALKFLFRKT